MLNSRGWTYVRETLRCLWDDYDHKEKRFREMTEIFGTQCANFDLKITGFNRSIYFLLVEWLRPILVVGILVYIESELFKLFATMLVQIVC